MKQILLAASLAMGALLSSVDSFAQTFRPGFIVQAEGDTIRGLIKYRESNLNYKSCVFKATDGAEAREYPPSDITAYGLTDVSSYESRDITDAKGASLKTFVEVLVRGRLNLYQYQSLLFLEKEKGDLRSFRLESEEVNTGERTILRTNANHLVLINSMTLDCPVPEAYLARIQKKIHVPNVIAVVDAYNNCVQPNSSISYKEDKPWLAIEKGILLGQHTTSLNFSAGPYSIKQAEFPLAHNPIAGGHLNLTSPRKSERISLHLEGFYSREKHLGYLELEGPLILFRNDYIVDIARISVASMARYTFANHRRISPYVGAGISSNFILSGKGNRRLEAETTIGNTRQIETSLSNTFLDKTFYGALTAAVGTSLRFNEKHKLLFQFRYEQGNYISGKAKENLNFSSHLDSNNSFYLTTAYILK